MALWILTFLFFFLGITNFLGGVGIGEGFGIKRHISGLKRVGTILQELEETLCAGLVPSPQRWAQLSFLQPPWGNLAFTSLNDLRSQGGALMPTLKRLRALATHHTAILTEAKAKSAQALAQAICCGVLVPVFGITLYLLLPGIAEHPWVWSLSCAAALLLTSVGIIWMLKLAQAARWAGLPAKGRPWILASQCAGEKFLAMVRSGTPADMAWTKTCDLLSLQAPDLALAWGHSIWAEPESLDSAKRRFSCGAASALINAGGAIRQAVQCSLMEGRPCTERVEAALHGLNQELKAHIERELSLLATRALKPLFICVAPALLGLLTVGLVIGWGAVSGGV